VAYPRQEAEIVELMKFCAAEHVALIPYGGGTSVVGGVEPPRSSDYAAVITVDMQYFNRILEVDTTSRCARIQAGIYGPALEAGLKPYNYTLRHFPQSFEFSTLGGWIATRASGHYATMYTHIDDFVESIRMLTPHGILETRRVPSSGAGPGPNQLILGSEGAFGFITEAWMRVQMSPAFKASAVIRFHETADGIQALKALSQCGLFPTNCRLISPLEAFMAGLGDGHHTILILGFESHDHALDAWIDRALAICVEYSGEWDANNVVIQSSADRRESGPADQWRRSFLQAPYLRDYLVSLGLIVETFETAITWDRFEPFHQKLVEAVQDAIATHCGRGLVTWRVTYVYPDGPVPYYTVIAQAQRDHELAQWADIKAVASNLILENGGTITHHHAVGKDHRPWYEQERSDLFNKVLSGAKRTLDPNWILNPEVLIPIRR
jgi:alkyldihydroxyacetonephosphate synthase